MRSPRPSTAGYRREGPGPYISFSIRTPRPAIGAPLLAPSFRSLPVVTEVISGICAWPTSRRDRFVLGRQPLILLRANTQV